MQFFTHKIPTGNNTSFSDLIRKVAGSEDESVKTASVEEENKVVTAEAGVDDDGEGKRTDVHHGEGSPEDQNGRAEEDGENMTVDAGAEVAETKVAESEGDSGPAKGEGPGDGEDVEGVNEGRFPEPDREDSDCYTQEAEDEGKADVEASGDEKQVKEAGELPEALKEHQFKSDDDKGDDDSEDSDGNDDADGKDDDAEKEACAASDAPNFEKIANLSPKAKSWLKNYWKMVYPEQYADAIVQDK